MSQQYELPYSRPALTSRLTTEALSTRFLPSRRVGRARRRLRILMLHAGYEIMDESDEGEGAGS
jgi:hypothetical protein